MCRYDNIIYSCNRNWSVFEIDSIIGCRCFIRHLNDIYRPWISSDGDIG